MTVETGTRASRVVWLERFYDIVFVACVGRFANELGTNPDLAHTLVVLGWLAGLWLAWVLVTARLNRFPDEGWLTRAILVAQLMCITVAAAAAVSATSDDDMAGVVAAAGISVMLAALYSTVPRRDVAQMSLLVVPIVGSVAVAAATLSVLVLPLVPSIVLTCVAVAGFAVAVFGFYLTTLARSQPVEPHHAADRHGQLFLVLMGLSFLKVAFASDPRTGVEFGAVAGAFLVGFSLWTLYVDGVLPLGFPVRPGPQRAWLVAQFALALAITVAAAAVTAVPVTESGTVSTAGALLEGGSFVVGLLALSLLVRSAERPDRKLAISWSVAGMGAAAVTAFALLVATPAATFSWLIASAVVLAAVAQVVLRRVARHR